MGKQAANEQSVIVFSFQGSTGPLWSIAQSDHFVNMPPNVDKNCYHESENIYLYEIRIITNYTKVHIIDNREKNLSNGFEMWIKNAKDQHLASQGLVKSVQASFESNTWIMPNRIPSDRLLNPFP